MRRAWSIIVAVIVFGLMAWNLLSGESLVGGPVVGVCLVLLTLTVTWWFEDTDRPHR